VNACAVPEDAPQPVPSAEEGLWGSMPMKGLGVGRLWCCRLVGQRSGARANIVGGLGVPRQGLEPPSLFGWPSPRRKRSESMTMIGLETEEKKTISHMVAVCESHPGHWRQVDGQCSSDADSAWSSGE
jgi:hypothetical protein